MITNDLQTRPSQETEFVLFFFPFGLFDQGLISTMVAQHNLPTLTSELKKKNTKIPPYHEPLKHPPSF